MTHAHLGLTYLLWPVLAMLLNPVATTPIGSLLNNRRQNVMLSRSVGSLSRSVNDKLIEQDYVYEGSLADGWAQSIIAWSLLVYSLASALLLLWLWTQGWINKWLMPTAQFGVWHPTHDARRDGEERSLRVLEIHRYNYRLPDRFEELQSSWTWEQLDREGQHVVRVQRLDAELRRLAMV